MHGSFRLRPPEPRPGFLSRPRLLRSVAKRWDHRVTALVGGAGVGKTTLLVQAMLENRLAPRGREIWVGLEPHDSEADRLASLIAAALIESEQDHEGDTHTGTSIPNIDTIRLMTGTAGEDAAESASRIAELLWLRSPDHTCLILDDVHHIATGSGAAAWLEQLLAQLPSNAHMVLASRTELALPSEGLDDDALVLREDELVFTPTEVAEFASQRDLDPARLDATGGWPAMAELTAMIRHPGRYLWDEVLEPLGSERRHVLAVLCDLGGADDQLMTVARGLPTQLDEALDGVPLITHDADGWHRPHSLWNEAPDLFLTKEERARIRRRAAGELCQRGRFDEAFKLAHEAELWSAVRETLRAACLHHDRLRSGQVGQWLSVLPDTVRGTPEGHLAHALHTAATAPERADEALDAALEACRSAGDVDGELAAISRRGQLAWWRHDVDTLVKLFPRVIELEAHGHASARGLASFGRALIADMAGDDETVLAELDSIQPQTLDATWDALASWLRGTTCLFLGRPEEADEIAERRIPTADPATRAVLEGMQVAAWWHLGQTEKVMERAAETVERLSPGGATNLQVGRLLATNAFAHTGDVRSARRWYDEAVESRVPAEGVIAVYTTAAKAVLELAEGDEAAAAATLRAAFDGGRHGDYLLRTGARIIVPLSYVLLPEIREYLDQAPLRASLRVPRDLAALVVAMRTGRTAALRDCELPDLGVVRTALHVRLAAELAVGLASVGRPEGLALLDVLGPAGRAAVRDTTKGATTRLTKPAKALLAAVPAPPPQPTYLSVLGPLLIHRGTPDSEPIRTPDLHRRKVHALLAYLLQNRRTTRTAICAALWPDLPERAAANNLSVTLNHLLRILEPWRKPGEPPFLARTEGPAITLIVGAHLHVDTDTFAQHLASAHRAESDGMPFVALEHYLAAMDFYRGDLHDDLDPDTADWLTLDREHYRTRFITTATRATHLLHDRGDMYRAQITAQRLLTVDPWNESAYTTLITANLDQGNLVGAQRLLDQCLASLDDLGIPPSPATQQLQQKLAVPETRSG